MLTRRSTGIHWHGVRQLNNNVHDGAPGVTECPIAPGSSKTYKFRVSQYGTSWYHTHFSAEYAYGVTGSIVFNGPASANYDIDLGPLPISDWYYGGIDDLLHRVNDPSNPFIAGQPGSPPPSDNVLINGTNINPLGAGGAYNKIVLTPGKTHRLRLINPSTDNTFVFSIVGHEFTIIETDFVPVSPTTVSSVYLAVGQRYDVLIDASQAVGNYWANITYSGTHVCGSSVNSFPAAILSYDGADDSLPTDEGTAAPDSLCQDDTTFVPIITATAPSTSFSATTDNTLPVTIDVESDISRVFWKVNGSAIDVDWTKPILEFVQEGNTSYPTDGNVITLPSAGTVSDPRFEPRLSQLKLTALLVVFLGHREPVTYPPPYPSPRKRLPPAIPAALEHVG